MFLVLRIFRYFLKLFSYFRADVEQNAAQRSCVDVQRRLGRHNVDFLFASPAAF